jgi:hypothetical protein
MAVTGCLQDDKLLCVILDSIRREQASPEERRLALVRAGLIAQAYGPLDSITEAVFGSLTDKFENNDELSLSGGSRSDKAAH